MRFREEGGKLREKCRCGDGWITKLEQEIRKVCRAHQEVVGPRTCPIYSSGGETVETKGGGIGNCPRSARKHEPSRGHHRELVILLLWIRALFPVKIVLPC